MRAIIAIALAASLAACGGGTPLSADELWKEAALERMAEECAPYGGVDSWEWHTSYYPYGPRKGEVFARGYTVKCGPFDGGKYRIIPHYPPVP